MKKTLTYLEAIREGLREEMRRDKSVFLLGEDVGTYGGAFKVTKGFVEEFGEDRVIDTVLAEAAIIGAATGAAIAGMHYIGIWSMRMAAHIMWDWPYVFLSIVIAFTASYLALLIAFKLRDDLTLKGFIYRGLGGVLMGFAIAGMLLGSLVTRVPGHTEAALAPHHAHSGGQR